MAKIFISAGHGGSDPGAVANGVKEKDLNLSIALACRDVLEKHGVSVKMSRVKNENDPLSEEIRECNAFAPDLAIDIHNNAGGGDGAEVFYHHGGGKGKTLAENILAEIVKIGQNSRGAKVRKNSQGKDYYGFIRETSCPAVIVECAFVDNAKDLQILSTESKRQAVGEAIAKGVLSTLGIEIQPKNSLYKVQVGAYLLRSSAEDLKKKIKAVGFDAFIVKE
jgi:N-acetylmuramoyl-L-alanine amidase